jgi:hypothetical protein
MLCELVFPGPDPCVILPQLAVHLATPPYNHTTHICQSSKTTGTQSNLLPWLGSGMVDLPLFSCSM